MEIKTRITQNEIIRFNLSMLYKKASVKVLIGIWLLITLYTTWLSLAQGKPFHFGSFSSLLIPPLILTVITVIATIINFKSNPRIQETIEYKFDDDLLRIKGESFSSELSWAKIHKVTLTKNFLLIWQSRQIANVILRKDIWEGDITHLKEILGHHQVKNNL
jgi:hypothetical protein